MDSLAIDASHVTLSPDGNDVEIRYLHAGDGPPLVFLHGIGLDAAAVSWRHILPKLAEHRSVYAPDLPGHGKSDAPRRTYTTEYYVDTLAAFLNELAIAGAGLVGLSMGGSVALGHALDGGSPERLVLVDSYGLGADAYWRQAASAALRMPFAADVLWGSVSSRAGVRANLQGLLATPVRQALVDDVYATVTSQSMRALRSWQRHEFRPNGLRTNFRNRLTELSMPTLLVHGASDPLFPVSWSRAASRALADGTIRVFDECGHWAPRECPERFNRVLYRFCVS